MCIFLIVRILTNDALDFSAKHVLAEKYRLEQAVHFRFIPADRLASCRCSDTQVPFCGDLPTEQATAMARSLELRGLPVPGRRVGCRDPVLTVPASSTLCSSRWTFEHWSYLV